MLTNAAHRVAAHGMSESAVITDVCASACCVCVFIVSVVSVGCVGGVPVG